MKSIHHCWLLGSSISMARIARKSCIFLGDGWDSPNNGLLKRHETTGAGFWFWTVSREYPTFIRRHSSSFNTSKNKYIVSYQIIPGGAGSAPSICYWYNKEKTLDKGKTKHQKHHRKSQKEVLSDPHHHRHHNPHHRRHHHHHHHHHHHRHHHQWSMINDKWSMIDDQWSMINDQSKIINHQTPPPKPDFVTGRLPHSLGKFQAKTDLPQPLKLQTQKKNAIEPGYWRFHGKWVF